MPPLATAAYSVESASLKKRPPPTATTPPPRAANPSALTDHR
eukprot:CAMPEP_0201901630 /NCGR_PEP_ID=MMETSP0902-20130614/54534_1 /ASSEMBLY_ACC=CAM_ASM_000551 /TAXON_ID=420261 /ORGANISM="Thalassiosira antarctica, Strain CCMP982" /LENGTH=41 /DNA_ID= /DNA_START= /DNA_END= /DNA_ORIENTATION=